MVVETVAIVVVEDIKLVLLSRRAGRCKGDITQLLHDNPMAIAWNSLLAEQTTTKVNVALILLGLGGKLGDLDPPSFQSARYWFQWWSKLRKKRKMRR